MSEIKSVFAVLKRNKRGIFDSQAELSLQLRKIDN